ncbi:LTA synthase family protein [Butyrivibrio sp. INlla16]|uniref:LTA synthase family protein n=1 Tax=Butyrivibrio sp. INlla16 TaxID=1520807 RepID=UPI000884D7F2|nr:LTA synthase family protein [Butyrivibrio sp. INlla16]SDB59872.1 Phosphoglycerol transferase MdoB [Butyrivibrio sp. INlla16]
MQNRIKRVALTLFITLPLVFVLLFFGYFPLHYDVVLHTDNVKGEGICQTYVCPITGVAAFYKVAFYFGSELEKATIKGYHYDVSSITLVVSDVSEFDITGIDSYIKGLHLRSFSPTDILPDGEVAEGNTAIMSSRDGALHVDVKDPDKGTTVNFSLPFIPGWFLAVYFALILLISILLAVVFTYIFDRFEGCRLFVMHAACIAITLLSGCFFCGSLSYVTYKNFLLNWLFLFAISLLMNALTFPILGTVVTMLFTTFWYIANYFVITLRNKPIMPADLKAIGTAKEVMGGYTFVPDWKIILGAAVVIFYSVLLIIIYRKGKTEEGQINKKKALLKRLITLAIGIVLIIVGINTKTFKGLSSFAWDLVLLKSFHEEGMVTTFLKSAVNSGVKRPEGYSSELINDYLSEYKSSTAIDEKAVQPTNIIMVMNEAFSDLRVVGMDESIDVMPFIDSLKENTIKGELSVGVFGGGTCNTEFEGLTGNTLAFLGAGAYPYTENVTDSMFSLASYFKNMGYSTDAFHVNEPQNWNRNMVYPNLGFDSFHSIKDFESYGEITSLHDLPADITDYRYMEAIDNENSAHPRFLFDVTMQNHSGYERWLDVEKAETVAENGNDLYVDTQVYLSLIKASDDAVKQLVETYKDSEEPTMIIFFGDHQPGLPGAAMDEIYTNVQSQLDLYRSKFFIWTNYDTEEQSDVQVSANYLPLLILERGNFPLPPYVQMLKELHDEFPIISSQGVMDKEGNIYTGVAEVMDNPLIKKYQHIQYANMFDKIEPAWFEINHK